MTREIHPPTPPADVIELKSWRPRLEIWGYDGTDLETDPASGRIVGEWPAIPGQARNLDFPTPAELCRCCGQVLLASGSRFSIWFCEQCDRSVRALNAEAGRSLIPRGRHSMCNSVASPPATQPTPAQIDAFLVAMRSLGRAIDVLHEWASEIVRRNCASLELAERTTIPLAEYLNACRVTDLSKETAFTEMTHRYARRVATRNSDSSIAD